MTVTDRLTGLDMLLFDASQVSSNPLSDLSRLDKVTVEVTVDPDDTSDEAGNGRPL